MVDLPKKGVEAHLVTARSAIPELRSPVLLNATASQDVMLDHVPARFVGLPIVRNYSNLTIRVLRASGIGKQAMTNASERRFSRMAQFLRRETNVGDDWFVVTHKAVSAIARKHLPGFTKLGHWGDLDGLNDFRDCNRAVLFGLSYREPEWPIRMYFALRGLRSTEWMRSERATKIKRMMHAKVLAAQVSQAIGRTRCRRVVDRLGNCLETEVFLTLPNDVKGAMIIRSLHDQFPGASITEWRYGLDGEFKTNGSQAWRQAVVALLNEKPQGTYSVNGVAEELKLDDKAHKAFKDNLKKRRLICDELEAIGVHYTSVGKGRSAKSLLIKI